DPADERGRGQPVVAGHRPGRRRACVGRHVRHGPATVGRGAGLRPRGALPFVTVVTAVTPATPSTGAMDASTGQTPTGPRPGADGCPRTTPRRRRGADPRAADRSLRHRSPPPRVGRVG